MSQQGNQTPVSRLRSG